MGSPCPSNNTVWVQDVSVGAKITLLSYTELIAAVNRECTRRGVSQVTNNTYTNSPITDNVYQDLATKISTLGYSTPQFIQDTIVFSSLIVSLRSAINSAEIACVCNCNYCNCNYCQCNYCQCNYCSCNCNHCECKCCWIFLEAQYGDGTMNKYVRRFRDEAITIRKKRGYYKLSEVFVPLMRKSKTFKFFVQFCMTDPMTSYFKYYYDKKGIGWIFYPITKSWLNLYDYLGGDHPFIRENGEVV